jgi:hypothetical protein
VEEERRRIKNTLSVIRRRLVFICARCFYDWILMGHSYSLSFSLSFFFNNQWMKFICEWYSIFRSRENWLITQNHLRKRYGISIREFYDVAAIREIAITDNIARSDIIVTQKRVKKKEINKITINWEMLYTDATDTSQNISLEYVLSWQTCSIEN